MRSLGGLSADIVRRWGLGLTFRRVRITIVAVEKQYVLNIMSVCLYSSLVNQNAKSMRSNNIVIYGLSSCTILLYII